MCKKIIISLLLLSITAHARYPLTYDQYKKTSTLAQKGIKLLIDAYNYETGGWGEPTEDWWHQAISLRLVLKYMETTKDFSYWDPIKNSYLKLGGAQFVNQYNDDMLWWALLWTDTYALIGKCAEDNCDELSRKKKAILNTAQGLYEIQMNQWEKNSFGDGLTWQVDGVQINAIENVLYILVGYRLYRVTNEHKYLTAADKALKFFDASFINHTNNYLDGLIIDGPINQLNKKKFMSYTHGIYIEALAQKIIILKNKEKFNKENFTEAQKVEKKLNNFLNTAIEDFTVRSVMREFREDLDTNQLQFKGIFALSLIQVASSNAAQEFLATQQKNILGIDPQLQRMIPGYWFNSKEQMINYITHTSGMSVFIASLNALQNKAP